MLSNTAERKPRPSAVCQDASGNFSTGIIEAAGHQREQEDRALEGLRHDLPVGLPQRRREKNDDPDRETKHRNDIQQRRENKVCRDIGGDGDGEDGCHDNQRRQSKCSPLGASCMIGEKRCCCIAAGMPKIQEGREAATYASNTLSGLMPSIHIIVVVVSPTTLPDAAGIRGRDDRRKIADMNFAPEHVPRHRAADQCGRDIVEKARRARRRRPTARGRLSNRWAATPASHPARGCVRNAAKAARIPSAAGTDWPGSPTRAACADRGRRDRSPYLKPVKTSL